MPRPGQARPSRSMDEPEEGVKENCLGSHALQQDGQIIAPLPQMNSTSMPCPVWGVGVVVVCERASLQSGKLNPWDGGLPCSNFFFFFLLAAVRGVVVLLCTALWDVACRLVLHYRAVLVLAKT